MTAKEAEGLIVKFLIVIAMIVFVVWASWKTYQENPDIKYFNERDKRIEQRDRARD